MPDSWCKQSYVQGFDYESITFNKAVNMFELMETAESVYEGVEEPSYKKPTRADANRAVQIRKNRGEVASSWDCPKQGEISGKRIKGYVDSLTGKSKPCLIHGPGHFSEECKFLENFGTKYAKSGNTKDDRSSPVPRKKINRQQENNSIVKNAVDGILLNETQKVSATNNEAP